LIVEITVDTGDRLLQDHGKCMVSMKDYADTAILRANIDCLIMFDLFRLC